MGKPTGFLEFDRKVGDNISCNERIKDFNEFHSLLSKEEQSIQGARCMDCGVPFCQSGLMINGMASGCPLNNLIPEFNDLIYKSNWDLALRRLLLTNPFPEFTGRVCPAPCEAACTVSINSPAVAIKENERAIIENAFMADKVKAVVPKYRTKFKVAVIGSGPAGLAAAYMLNRYGHTVEVFEKEDKLGGLLMYGIPNMKLEKQVIDRRIDLLLEEGVRFNTSADICLDTSLREKVLKEFDAIILATGAGKPRDLTIKGRELKGIHFAVEYLKENTRAVLTGDKNENYIDASGKKVLIIGGGDTGTDCVATALRQKASWIRQLEITNPLPKNRESNNPWPEWSKTLKVDYGQEEFISLHGEDPRHYCSSIKEFIGDENGNLKAAKVIKVSWYKTSDNKLSFKEVEGSEETVEVDLVFLAMGFTGTEDYILKSLDLAQDNRGNIKANEIDFKTSKNKFFAAGDSRRGQSLVVWAIKEGLEVAKSVNKHLLDL